MRKVFVKLAKKGKDRSYFMKKIPFTILILISFIYASQAQNTNSFSQDSTTNFKTPPYKLAAGIRLPLYGIMIDPGISAKYFLGKKVAL